ncbi:invasion associated locus B family protein [Devosia limi]|nr:invasion associated locus B family protein [Devosia limi]
MLNLRTALFAAASLALSGAAHGQEAPASTLPGGASLVTETHGDWTVTCTTPASGKQCAFSQALADSQSGQRVLMLELTPPQDGTLAGMLVGPFGLNFANGLALAVDGEGLGAPLPFLTCIPTGCLVPLSFDSAQLDQLKAGATLTATGIGADTQQPVPISVSLTGFTRALERTAELAQ